MRRVSALCSRYAGAGLLRCCIFTALAGILLLLGLGVRAVLDLRWEKTSCFNSVVESHRSSDLMILDRHGRPLHQVRVDRRGRRLDWTPLHEISPALVTAVIAAEDKRFYEHSGIDWKATVHGMVQTLIRAAPRGASTVTMQVVALLDDDLRRNSGRRQISQKLRQMNAARTLEQSWTKDQILEVYLNLATFRSELQGVSSASRAMFGKDPHGLGPVESAFLAVLLRAPNASVERTAARAAALAASQGIQVTPAEMLARAGRFLSGPYQPPLRASLAPHAARLLIQARRENDSDRNLISTVDRDLQVFASQILREQLTELRLANVGDAALLVLDNASGDILAYLGNAGGMSTASHVDGVRALRQAGSSLKPFLYALALQEKLLTPASLLDDSPLDVPDSGGLYRPRNYDNSFSGLITARTALAASLNIPAVRTIHLVGVDAFVNGLQKLSFRGLREPEFYGPSLALGSADVCLWDLTNAYRTLANGGLWSPLRLAPSPEPADHKRVLSAQAVFLVSDILGDRESRSHTFHLESPLGTRYWSAVKTGTSKDMRDNWCVGYSDRYTVGVWVGNFSGEPMWNVSGISGAAPVWVEIMNYLHRYTTSRPPSPPQGLVTARLPGPGRNGESRQEWFIAGTETSTVVPNEARQRILYPAAQTILALDPDIPEEQQRVFFESRSADPNHRWRLNGEFMGDSASSVLWRPHPGPHLLELVDAGGRVVDSVKFQVRGE
jgi:penicillin-binding protein 1C